MNTGQLPRREFLAATAGSLAAFPMTAYALNHSQFQRQSNTNGASEVKGKFPIKAISSHNGLEATKRAYGTLEGTYGVLGESDNLDSDFFEGVHEWSNRKTVSFLKQHLDN